MFIYVKNTSPVTKCFKSYAIRTVQKWIELKESRVRLGRGPVKTIQNFEDQTSKRLRKEEVRPFAGSFR